VTDGLIAPLNAPPGQGGILGTQPGVTGAVLVANRVIISGPGGALLVYSPTTGAGNLIFSVDAAAGTDSFGNNTLPGATTYASTFATSMNSGFIAFYTGSLAGGWTLVSSVAGDVAGNLQANATGQLQLVGSTGVTISGTLTVNGSTSTGNGSNGGVTSGPSGTVGAFPAAGPNHTHAEAHTHTL
jgi:hypothetical protein